MINVLVVDDDADLVEMVTILLTQAGMRVHSLNDADQITDTTLAFKPDVILLDIYLGNHDGRHICQELKTSERFSSIPVILYSAGHITSASIQKSLADTFIPKPFDMDDIVEKIRTLAK